MRPLILLLLLADNGLATGFTYYQTTQGMTWTNAMFAEIASATWERCDAVYVARPSFAFSNSLYAGTTQTITVVTNTGAGYTNIVTSTNDYAVWIELWTTNTFFPFVVTTNVSTNSPTYTNMIMPRITAGHLASVDSSLYGLGVKYLEYWLADTNGYYDTYLATKSVVTNIVGATTNVTTNYPGSLPAGNRSAFFQASSNGYFYNMKTDAYGRVYSDAGADKGWFAYGPSNVQPYTLCDASYTNNGTNANSGRWIAYLGWYPRQMMAYTLADSPPVLWLSTTSSLGDLTVRITGTTFRASATNWQLFYSQVELVTVTAANTTSSPAASTNYWYQVQDFAVSPSNFTPYPNASVVMAYTGVVSFYAAPIQMTSKVYNERVAYLKELKHSGGSDLILIQKTTYIDTESDTQIYPDCAYYHGTENEIRSHWTTDAESIYGALTVGSTSNSAVFSDIFAYGGGIDGGGTDSEYDRAFDVVLCADPCYATNSTILFSSRHSVRKWGLAYRFAWDNTNVTPISDSYSPPEEVYAKRSSVSTNPLSIYNLDYPADWPTTNDVSYARFGSGNMQLVVTSIWMKVQGVGSYMWATQYCMAPTYLFTDYFDVPPSPPTWDSWWQPDRGNNPWDLDFVPSKSMSIAQPSFLSVVRWNTDGGFIYQ